MAEIKNQTLSGVHAIDGQTFTDVLFKDVTLTYSGGQPPVFQNCRFEGTTFNFVGHANSTVQFLNAMAPTATNMRDVVLGLIPALKD
jgi:hypothetical protein